MTPCVTDEQIRAMIRQGQKSSHPHAKKRVAFWQGLLDRREQGAIALPPENSELSE